MEQGDYSRLSRVATRMYTNTIARPPRRPLLFYNTVGFAQSHDPSHQHDRAGNLWTSDLEAMRGDAFE